MAWGWFALATAAVLLVQTTILPLFPLKWVDLLLALALVCGLAAPSMDARLAAWMVGFAQDLASAGPMGLNALVFGLAVSAMTYLREIVFRQRWPARLLVAMAAALPAQLIVLTWLHARQGEWLSILLQASTTALAASAVAAVVVGLPGALGRGRRGRYSRW